ncbi:MAG TPA: MaoC/PaaZ C-terminal domain-containing protein [Ferrovibrio sp.]|uniref:MaoC/PaaZ C-terminal domain-containing protein n=1 Tax=Ferrovibrio sp. TaxID=1917215 RepID=UPI002B4B25D8|nr:MaoC/PaaZ C-terminal domain-containing protein [Ferrovibrio sp.]HLT75817.1 MaoC/PaaZ C-terminal domain-containing protein [Ferrovibrio sp.]
MTIEPDRTELAEFSVSAEDMAAFRRLSGDTNPLHDDETFARGRGFEGPVVYGALIVAQISQLLGTRLPGPGCVWRSLSLRFRGPLYVGQHARLAATIVHANEDIGTVDLKLRVDAGGRCIADGETAALLKAEPAARPPERVHA